MDTFCSLSLPEIGSLCRKAAAVVAVGCALRFTLHHLRTITSVFRAYFLAPRGIGRTELTNYGTWAVVTGASDGIGRGYALELARRGLKIVLISRSQQKLESVANEIRELYDTEVIIVSADFTKGQEVFSNIAEKLKDLDIAILVNNVGLSYIHPDYFLEVSEERHRQIIEVNCQTMVQMTHMLLPMMLRKNKGIIVNLSSISDLFPCMMLVTYGASKRFVRYFTDALRCEYGSRGIIFQTVASGMVTTAMSNARKVTFFTPDPVTYSRAAAATIGIQDYTHGFWPHELYMCVYGLLSKCIQLHLTAAYMKRSRRILIRRKSEGTLVSQLRVANSM